jgi:gas vesicle GvpC-like protein
LEINASQRILQKSTNPYNVVPGEAISGRSGLIYYFLENFMISLMAKIRQEHQSLSLETREFLSVTTAKRQEQAEKQAQELQAFYKDLQETSQQFLSATADARTAQAKEQKESLLKFRQDLFVSIFG